MRLLLAKDSEHPHDPVSRFKVTFLSVCALVGAFIAGSWAPTILESLFNGIRGFYKNQPATTTEGEVAVHPAIKGPTEVHKAPPTKSTTTTTPELRAGIQEPTPNEDRLPYPTGHTFVGILPFAILGALLGAFLGNVVLDFFAGLTDRWNKMDAGDKVTTVLGVIAGVVMSIPFIVIFQSLAINANYVPWLILLMTLGSITLSIYILQSIGEFFPWNRGRGPAKRSGIKLLDTNVIIDGRIYDVAQNGFLEGQLYVPQFVLEELQFIADHHDPLRRQRGKRGLEVLRHLQAEFQLEVGTQDKLAPEQGDPVDSRLVRLARALGADLVTNDHNLNRVAALQDVKVLNLNDLALALRPNVLPQETLMLTLIREGNQPGQGVGYLDDGTMVVVENGRSHLGETLEIEVTQVIQTERGKMIFGEVDKEEEESLEGARKRPSGVAPKRY